MKYPILLAFVLPLAAAVGSDVSRLDPGTLPPAWRASGPQCSAVPDWQVHQYNPEFYILRESGCLNYEKPFLYLIFGQDKVLLEDTGADGKTTAAFVSDLIEKWAQRRRRDVPQLVVIHSHGHGDHVAGDTELQKLPGIQFIASTPAEIQKAAGITSWPEGRGQIDL